MTSTTKKLKRMIERAIENGYKNSCDAYKRGHSAKSIAESMVGNSVSHPADIIFNQEFGKCLWKFESEFSIDELRVLENCYDGLYYAYKYLIPSNEYTLEDTKKIVKGLIDKGVLEYKRGLMNDDGKVAGSGFGVTYKYTDIVRKDVKRFWDYKDYVEQQRNLIPFKDDEDLINRAYKSVFWIGGE